MEVNINLKSKYNIGDKVYFIWPGDNFNVIKAVVIGIKPCYGDNNNNDTFTFAYTLSYDNGKIYGRYEDDLFKTEIEAKLYATQHLVRIICKTLYDKGIVDYPIK